MAKPKTRPNLYDPKIIPDHVWIPFVAGLTGDLRHNTMAINNLAHFLNIPAATVKHRLQQELDEQRILVQPESRTIH
jgi:hypothetical protein